MVFPWLTIGHILLLSLSLSQLLFCQWELNVIIICFIYILAIFVLPLRWYTISCLPQNGTLCTTAVDWRPLSNDVGASFIHELNFILLSLLLPPVYAEICRYICLFVWCWWCIIAFIHYVPLSPHFFLSLSLSLTLTSFECIPEGKVIRANREVPSQRKLDSFRFVSNDECVRLYSIVCVYTFLFFISFFLSFLLLFNVCIFVSIIELVSRMTKSCYTIALVNTLQQIRVWAKGQLPITYCVWVCVCVFLTRMYSGDTQSNLGDEFEFVWMCMWK